jgi:tryptophan-rich sensory protein
MKESTFKTIEPIIWVAYLVALIFSGLLVYHPLPNEYDAAKHELLKSHIESCGAEGIRTCKIPDKWRDKKTGKIYTADQFAGHRHAEAKRIAGSTFAYGLLGCLFFAFSCVVKRRGKFFTAFGKALLLDIFAAVLMYFLV